MTTGREYSDPSAVKHPIGTAIGVLIMIAVIVVGVVLWVRGASEKVQITSTTFSGETTQVGPGVTATPLRVAVQNDGGKDLRITSIDTAVLDAYNIEPCFTPLPAAEPVSAQYTVGLPEVTPTAPALSATTVSTVVDFALPHDAQQSVSLSVGPVAQPVGRVQAFVFRSTLDLDDGGRLGMPAVAMGTTAEAVQTYLAGVAALDAAGRAGQSSCAAGQVERINRLFGQSSLRWEPLVQLRDAYASLADRG